MKQEFYIRNNALIAKQDWEKSIINMKSALNTELGDKQQILSLLKDALIKAVNERLPDGRLPDEKFGVMFSGGVDSSLIALLAKKAGKDFICYTVGFKEEDTKEPEDVIVAVKAAKTLGLKLKTKVFDSKEAEQLIKKTARIVGNVETGNVETGNIETGKEINTVVNVGVGSVLLGCIELAKKDGVKYLFSGLGSEELFAGYHRHKLAKNKQEECWQGLMNMYERDLLRDNAIAVNQKISFITPFLDKDLILLSMRIPDKLKISNDSLNSEDSLNDNSKIILREAAQELGLPAEIAWRAKRAAQYGSRLDKAISKLARQKGFKLKKDYLKSLIA